MKHYTGERFGAWVLVEPVAWRGWLCRCDCGTERVVKMSTMTSGRSRSCGDRDIHPAKSHGPARGDDVGYHAAHKRVRTDRGSARKQTCVDCAGPALDWSYVGGDPRELFGPNALGHWMPYSADPDYYVPRCRRCHVIHDRQMKGRKAA